MAELTGNTSAHWKKLLAPWVLVITGILFNIISAVITNYFIGQNNAQVSQLEEKSQRIDAQINNYWQNRQNIERKMEFILLLQQNRQHQSKTEALANQDSFAVKYINQFIKQLRKQYFPEQYPPQENVTPSANRILNGQQIVTMIEKIQDQIINDIDEVYFDKLVLEKEKRLIVELNSQLMSIALFLQLVGLILVLAKDFQRRT